MALLLPTASAKKLLDSTHGRYRVASLGDPKRKYSANFRKVLGEFTDSPDWRARVRYLALAGCYLEGRSRRSHTAGMAYATDMLSDVAASSLPAEAKYHVFRTLACPALAQHESQWNLIRMNSYRRATDNYAASTFPYHGDSLLRLLALIRHCCGISVDPITVLQDFLVTAWLEQHAKFWATAPDTYEKATNVSSWTNTAKSDFIRWLIDADLGWTNRARTSRNQVLTDDAAYAELVPDIIASLAESLQVDLKSVEANRIFYPVISNDAGRPSARSTSTSSLVWRGLANTPFADAAKHVLSTQSLLNLLSHANCLYTAPSWSGRSALGRLLLSVAVPESAVLKVKQTLAEFDIDLGLVPEARTPPTAFWQVLYGDSSERVNTSSYSEEERRVNELMTGTGSVLFRACDTASLWTRLHEAIKAKVLPDVEQAAVQLITENAAQLKELLEVFYILRAYTAAAEDSDLPLLSSALPATAKNPTEVLKHADDAAKCAARSLIAGVAIRILDKSSTVLPTAAISFSD